jgi:hypothetical protein
MDVAAFVDVLQRLGHINDDLRHVLEQHGIMAGVEHFKFAPSTYSMTQ